MLFTMFKGENGEINDETPNNNQSRVLEKNGTICKGRKGDGPSQFNAKPFAETMAA